MLPHDSTTAYYLLRSHASTVHPTMPVHISFFLPSSPPSRDLHSFPTRRSSDLAAGDVLLLDLWAGPALGSVFADQTWMGFAGREPSADVARVWEAVRGARDAAVGLLRDRWKKQEAVTGAALDDVARGVIRAAGFGDYF